MVRLAIVGTGGMGNEHARQFAMIPDCEVVAACDINRKRAESFAEEHAIPEVYSDLEHLLSGCTFDAVSNVTPDSVHSEISLRLLEAGKHVLCEKPLATRYSDALGMQKAAEKAGVINMVNFSYRGWAAIETARDLVQSGKLGRIIHFESHYLQSWLSSKIWGDWRASDTWLWRLSKKHGSQGVLGDIGVHAFEMTTLPVGPVKSVHCKLKTFQKADGDKIDEYVLDANDSAVITVELENGGLGTLHLSRWATGYANRLSLTVHGDLGALRMVLDDGADGLEVCLGNDVDTCTWNTYPTDPVPNIYQRFITGIQTGKNPEPDFARGADVQRVLDACFLSAEKNCTVDVASIL